MKNIKNIKKASKALMMGTAMVSLGALSAMEAQAASGTGTMSAVILAPITVAGTQNLHFGSMTDGGVGGTMVVTTTTGARTPTGVVAVAGLGNEIQGQISVGGATGVNIVLSMAATAYTVSNGTATMSVNNFNLVSDAGGAGTQVVTLAANPSSFEVGATLNVAAAQAPGTYTGTYVVNAAYQ